LAGRQKLAKIPAMTKVLLLGLGRWGANHLRNLNNLPVELYVAEVGEKQLEPARKLGLPAERLTTNYKEFINKIDGVVVVTPAQSHFPLCKEFLEAGKDVFVEKPLTLTNEDSKALAEIAEKHKRILQVGHILRFDPATLWLRDAVQNGEFGKVNMIRGHFGFKRPRNDSGVMFADGIHFADLFNFILGAQPKTVQAINHDFMGRGVEDVSFVSLEYDTPHGKTWATVEAEYFIPGKFREVIVCGDKLSAVCDYNVAQYKIKTYANLHTPAGGMDFKATEGIVTQIETPPEEPLLAELRTFIDSIKTRATPRADAWSGYHAVRVMNAALESVKTGKAVQI
jgi:UDP-N-acetylglucosamine 3-dehydrogenase